MLDGPEELSTHASLSHCYDSLFLYLVLGALLSAAGYYTFQTIKKQYFTTKPLKGSKGKRGNLSKTVVPANLAGKGYPETVKPYEEEWLPDNLKSGAGGLKKRKGGKVAGEVGTSGAEGTSGGEGLTSGAETSGTERKGKGKGGKKGSKK